VKLSVIIPIYRVEHTLDRAVKSVLSQNVAGMEVILVDDGSPDQCPKMCDEWADKDPRVKVIHKTNGGLSDARNAGIDVATGSYITFVDSDDWIALDTYAPLLERMDDCDILEYSIADRLELTDRKYEDYRDYWLKEKVYTHCYAWNKIYKHTLFNNIRYPKGKIFEDVYTLPALLRKARKIITTAQGHYHYNWNPHGITATADGQGLSLLLQAHLDSGMPLDDNYYMHLVNIQMDVRELTGAPVVLPFRKVNTQLVEGNKRMKAFALNLIGINHLCIINKFIHHFKNPSR